MSSFISILIGFGALAVGGASVYFIYNQDLSRYKLEDEDSEKFIESAKEESKKIKKEARERIEKQKEFAQEEEKSRKEQINHLKKSIDIKDNTLKRKESQNTETLEEFNLYKKDISDIKINIKRVFQEQKDKLEKISGKTIEELTKKLHEEFSNEIINNKEGTIKKKISDIKEDIEKKAKTILLLAMQRYTGPTSIERRNTNVVIPKNIIKGMLIGKEGVNLVYLEKIFPDLSFIFNHEPKTLTIGGFNLLQKHVAKLTISKLLHKKAIGHKDIQNAYDKAKKEIDDDIVKTGKTSLNSLGIKNVPDELVWLVGRLKYRTSYGQNILAHSLEMAFFAEMIASELGCDSQVAKESTFFHDIGKAVDHDENKEEGHDVITKEILEKHNYPEEIVHAAYAHHEAEEAKSMEALIVRAVDSISAGRPGVRQESLKSYLERIEALERIAFSIEGVDKAYSVSAGREVRMFVNPDTINDEKLDDVADDAAGQIEKNLTYPGKIKVTVIRTLKASDVAK